MKLCLSCMKSISSWAGKCPYCLDGEQGVLGRVVLLLLILFFIFIGGNIYLHQKEHKENPKKELVEILNKYNIH